MHQGFMHRFGMRPVNVITQKIQGYSAIHGAAVNIKITQVPGQLFGKCTFSTRRPPIDGDYNLLLHKWYCKNMSRTTQMYTNELQLFATDCTTCPALAGDEHR